MLDMIWSTPIDMIGCCVYPEDELQVNEAGVDKYLHTEGGLMVNIDLLESGEVYYLLREQAGKDFYIPSATQLVEIDNECYESSSIDYKNLKAFFKRKMHMDEEVARTWCLNVWMNSYQGDMPSDIVKKLNENGIVFDIEKDIDEFMTLLMKAHNSTRLIENRGHKPAELLKNERFDRMPTIVPASSKAAGILAEMKPQLESIGMTVKLDQKIYPNDSCPCGSGKKYKKCCGRK